MATGKETEEATEEAMVRALERRERAKSASGGLFALSFIVVFAAMIFLAVQLNLGGWYVAGGALACVVIAGLFSDWVMRRAKERAPDKY